MIFANVERPARVNSNLRHYVMVRSAHGGFRSLRKSLWDRLKPPGDVKQYQDISEVEHELSEHCLELPGSESSEECWLALKSLRAEQEKASAECDVQNPDTCRHLEQLENKCHGLRHDSSTGFDAIVQAFVPPEQRKHKPKADPAAEERLAEKEKRREHLKGVFQKFDSNKDGKLNILELSAALKSLGEELDEVEMMQAMEAIDSHGLWVDQDGFVDIAEAELERSHDPVVELLRHQAHTHKHLGF